MSNTKNVVNPFEDMANMAIQVQKDMNKKEKLPEPQNIKPKGVNPFEDMANMAIQVQKDMNNKPTPPAKPQKPGPGPAPGPGPGPAPGPAPIADPGSEPEGPVEFIEDNSVNKECKYDPEQYILVGMLDDYCILYDKINDKIYNNINKDDIDQSSLEELTDEQEPAPMPGSGKLKLTADDIKQVLEEWIQNAVKYITDSPGNGKNPEVAFEEKNKELEYRYGINDATEDVVVPRLEHALELAREKVREMERQREPEPKPEPKPIIPTPKPEPNKKITLTAEQKKNARKRLKEGIKLMTR